MTNPIEDIRIAIACSGLGHIRRGVETWAEDLARALRRQNQNVTLFQGGGVSVPSDRTISLSSPSRFDPKVAQAVRICRKLGGWRYGLGSDYQFEQTLFAVRLWQLVWRDFDILHVQDPWIALLMERLHRAKLSRPRVILGHGTEEPVKTLQKYSYLQHLAPCYLDDWNIHRPKNQKVFAIPNFVDTKTFVAADKKKARLDWNLPQDSLVVLSVGAIKSSHKRMDYLIREFSVFSKQYRHPAVLVIAGAREAETDQIISIGQNLLGDRIRILEGVDRIRMPSLYQSADIFTIASLHEMLGIAFLEALSCGVPIICNDTPTLRWVAGQGGFVADLTIEGELARQFQTLSDFDIRLSTSTKARYHAEHQFSESVVIQQYLKMYESVSQPKLQTK